MENLAPGIKQRFKEQLTELATKYTLLESHSEQDINIMIDILKRLEQGESEYLDIDKALEVLELIGKYYVEAVEYYLWWRENIDKCTGLKSQLFVLEMNVYTYKNAV